MLPLPEFACCPLNVLDDPMTVRGSVRHHAQSEHVKFALKNSRRLFCLVFMEFNRSSKNCYGRLATNEASSLDFRTARRTQRAHPSNCQSHRARPRRDLYSES